MFWTISLERKSVLVNFIVYFGKIITKQGNRPEIDNVLRFSNSSQKHKDRLYFCSLAK